VHLSSRLGEGGQVVRVPVALTQALDRDPACQLVAPNDGAECLSPHAVDVLSASGGCGASRKCGCTNGFRCCSSHSTVFSARWSRDPSRRMDRTPGATASAAVKSTCSPTAGRSILRVVRSAPVEASRSSSACCSCARRVPDASSRPTRGWWRPHRRRRVPSTGPVAAGGGPSPGRSVAV
jgi:hypothetical protein